MYSKNNETFSRQDARFPLSFKFWLSWGSEYKYSKTTSKVDFFIIHKGTLKFHRHLRGLFDKNYQFYKNYIFCLDSLSKGFLII